MPVDILLTVIATSVIQSIFGVGVLLFGTPLLLLLGYEFLDALVILLPISIAINSFQILKHYSYIDLSFYKNVLIYTIPFVVLFLFIVTAAKINIALIIGLFLIFVALKSYSPKVEKMMMSMVKYEKTYLATMGVIHGLTNLGGSLLTAIVHGKQYQKDMTRVTVAICYATFAVFQIVTLFFLLDSYELSYSNNMAFLHVGVIMFLLTEEVVYQNIDNEKYSKIFAAFLFLSGVVLVFKAF
jgi:uncharacterized protein